MQHQFQSTNHSSNTVLKDRILWHDGDSTFSEQEIVQKRISGMITDGFYVDVLTPAIENYNGWVLDDKKIKVKENVRDIIAEWQLPESFASLNVVQHIHDLCYQYCVDRKWIYEGKKGLVITEKATSVVNRVSREIQLYKKYNLFMLLRSLIFVINTLQSHNAVWGVGRGSGVSSFVLYLLGVHDVDSIEYDLSIEDFLHD